MNKKIELYKLEGAPEIEFKNVEYCMEPNSGAEAILCVAYTMLPSESMGILVSKIFENIHGTPTRDKFMMEFWKLCRESFYED